MLVNGIHSNKNESILTVKYFYRLKSDIALFFYDNKKKKYLTD